MEAQTTEVKASPKIEALRKAQTIFKNAFLKEMKSKNLDGFKRDYPTLYHEVIIPVITKQCYKVHLAGEAVETWERLMMDLVGEDGPGSVRTAIEQLKLDRDAYLFDVKQLRKTVKYLQDALKSARQAGERDMKNGDKPASEMTKREYFASVALNGLLAFEGTDNGLLDPKRKFNCKTSVRYAESMLSALENSNQ